MIDPKSIKDIPAGFGADICGIAPVERFEGAPVGFHPTDIFEDCRSVLVFANRLPASPLNAQSCIPYNLVFSVINREVDSLTIHACRELEHMGIKAVPVPSDEPYEHWEPDRSYGRAILSLRHAAHLAGLGVLGRNTLLMNKDYGNMVWLGAILIDVELQGDPLAVYEGCPPHCDICIDTCPAGALDGKTVNQELCRPTMLYRTGKGHMLYKCYLCRRECPNALGIT